VEGEDAEVGVGEPSRGEFDGVFFGGDPEGGLGGEAAQVLGAVAVVVEEAALGGDARTQRFQCGAQRRGATRATRGQGAPSTPLSKNIKKSLDKGRCATENPP